MSQRQPACGNATVAGERNDADALLAQAADRYRALSPVPAALRSGAVNLACSRSSLRDGASGRLDNCANEESSACVAGSGLPGARAVLAVSSGSGNVMGHPCGSAEAREENLAVGARRKALRG